MKKVLELISNNSKIAGHKVNIQKSISFLYTSNEQLEFEVKSTLPLALTVLLGIREIRIKTTMRYYLTPVRMAKINKSGNNKCW